MQWKRLHASHEAKPVSTNLPSTLCQGQLCLHWQKPTCSVEFQMLFCPMLWGAIAPTTWELVVHSVVSTTVYSERNVIQKLEHLQKCLKSYQIKNGPVAVDANNNMGCRPEIAAIFLVPVKSTIKSSRGCRMKPSILSEFHSAILAEILKYSIGIVALL